MIDLPGKAIKDFYKHTISGRLYVHDTFGPKTEMPINVYFRTFNQMPKLEQLALELCKGKILDIGAGAGAHTLELQQMGKEAYALEISPNACQVMRHRGIQHVICEDIFTHQNNGYDTLLLLMNGIGLSGSVKKLEKFLDLADKLLNEDGQIIFDSCDISYIYEDFEWPKNRYYGEVKCKYEYMTEFTEWFQWLYIDQETMRQVANDKGWACDILFEDDQDQYLATLKRV